MRKRKRFLPIRRLLCKYFGHAFIPASERDERDAVLCPRCRNYIETHRYEKQRYGDDLPLFKRALPIQYLWLPVVWIICVLSMIYTDWYMLKTAHDILIMFYFTGFIIIAGALGFVARPLK